MFRLDFRHRHRWTPAGLLACIGWMLHATGADAHGISESSRVAMTDGGLLDYIWLGAEHMVTGYDHLLFLFGVIFFLTGIRDVVRFITAFTLGHCITLLGATLLGITANAYLIDAVIAVSVIYKGFENLDGFNRFFKMKVPDLLVMVFVFGLIHGFGLSTRLQELPLGEDGLVARILAFNVGVELGQVAALTAMLGFFALWRSSAAFSRFDRAANVLLCLAGGGLFVFQMAGFAGVMPDEHHDHAEAPDQEFENEHGHEHGHGAHDHGHEEAAKAAEPPEPPEPADPAQSAGEHGHAHGAHDHGPTEATKAAESSPAAEGHAHGHGAHVHEHKEAAKAAEPAPAAGGHTHGHGSHEHD